MVDRALWIIYSTWVWSNINTTLSFASCCIGLSIQPLVLYYPQNTSYLQCYNYYVQYYSKLLYQKNQKRIKITIAYKCNMHGASTKKCNDIHDYTDKLTLLLLLNLFDKLLHVLCGPIYMYELVTPTFISMH